MDTPEQFAASHLALSKELPASVPTCHPGRQQAACDPATRWLRTLGRARRPPRGRSVDVAALARDSARARKRHERRRDTGSPESDSNRRPLPYHVDRRLRVFAAVRASGLDGEIGRIWRLIVCACYGVLLPTR